MFGEDTVKTRCLRRVFTFYFPFRDVAQECRWFYLSKRDLATLSRRRFLFRNMCAGSGVVLLTIYFSSLGSLCESFAHSRYIWFNSANREDERRGRRGPDGARWSPPTIRRARAIAWAPCAMDVTCEHRLDVRRDEHLPPTSYLSSTTTTPSSLDGASKL